MASVMVCSGQGMMYNLETANYTPVNSIRNVKYTSFFQREDVHREYARRCTFLLWPASVPVCPDHLAAAGFFYTGLDDTCQCFSCGLRLRNWRENDDPFEMHKKHSPRCAMVLGSEDKNVPLDEDPEVSAKNLAVETTSRVAGRGSIESDSSPVSVPRGKKNGKSRAAKNRMDVSGMHSRKNRLESFRGKWRKADIVTPEDLADVGFYYGGDQDRVVCAFCGLRLRNWVPGDTAFGEHFKNAPNCPFLSEPHAEPEADDDQVTRDEDLFLKEDVEDTSPQSQPTLEETVHLVKQLGHSDDVIKLALKQLRAIGGTQIPSASVLLDEVYKVEDQGGSSLPSPPEPRPPKPQDPELVKLKEENDRLKMKCHACKERQASVLLLPCRHLVSCGECARQLKNCPKCHGVVRGVVKTFFV